MVDTEFFKKTIEELEKTQAKIRLDYERNQGVIQFCKYILEKGLCDEKKEAQVPIEQ